MAQLMNVNQNPVDPTSATSFFSPVGDNAQWDDVKNLIIYLYLDKNMSLKQVRSALAKIGFDRR